MHIEKLKNIQSIDELEKLGSKEDVKSFLQEIVAPLKINASSYQEIYETLKMLQQKHIDFIDGFFKSKQDEYLFYLTKLEGKQRNQLLGLTDEHYVDKELAKKWYREISNYVHPDKNGDGNAFHTLRNLYNVLIEEDKD